MRDEGQRMPPRLLLPSTPAEQARDHGNSATTNPKESKMTATVIRFQPGPAGDRFDEVRAVASGIEQEPGRETEFLERLARSFYDAPIHPEDEVGSVIKDLLAALLKNRGKAMPEARRCPRCDVPVNGNGAIWERHSSLCQNIDGTETELSDEAVIAAMKVLKRREEAAETDDIPF